MRDDPAEHHHGGPDRKAYAHSALVQRPADAGKWFALAGRVKPREAPDAALAAAVEQAGDDGDVARFDVTVRGEVSKAISHQPPPGNRNRERTSAGAKNGAGDEARTRDVLLGKEVLYH